MREEASAHHANSREHARREPGSDARLETSAFIHQQRMSQATLVLIRTCAVICLIYAQTNILLTGFAPSTPVCPP